MSLTRIEPENVNHFNPDANVKLEPAKRLYIFDTLKIPT
jgi:hypothetical protein